MVTVVRVVHKGEYHIHSNTTFTNVTVLYYTSSLVIFIQAIAIVTMVT